MPNERSRDDGRAVMIGGGGGVVGVRARRFRAAVTAAVAMLGVVASVLVGASPASADAIRDREYWLADYGITTAWGTTKGAGVTVAVIDTGVDGTHPDLVGAVVGGTDVSGLGTPDGLTPVGDDSAHGTLVASLLAGRGHGRGGSLGVVGIAPEASILAVSVGFGTGSISSDDQIARAVRWSVDNGADVINMSLTRNTLEWPQSWDDAFLYAMENDVVVVAAAGNRGSGTTEVGAPATMPGVVTVAGVDRQGSASSDASAQGITISVAAPSEGLVGAGPGNQYYEWEGTSGAAPLVSGLVALIRAAHPELDAANTINRLIRTATPVGAEVPGPIYGYGLIDADAAVTTQQVEAVTENPMGDLADWIRVNRRAEVLPAPSTEPAPRRADEPARAAGPGSPMGVLLPTIPALRDTGIPILVFSAFAAALGGAVVLARRDYRRRRRVEGGSSSVGAL